MQQTRHLTILFITVTIILSACSSVSSTKVSSLQRKDKTLSCKELLLEINEADFYLKTAQNNRNPKVTTFLMPLGYISTYMSAEEAISAASARIDYLDRIYEILKCDDEDATNVLQKPPHSDYGMGKKD